MSTLLYTMFQKRFIAPIFRIQMQGLLTCDDFNYGEAAENMAFRWQAMAEAYERMGLFNERRSS